MIIKFLKIFTLVFVITLGGGSSVKSQSSRTVIPVNDIPADGILLDSGWRFHVGDSPEYSSPSFDDGSWEPIDPTLDIHTSLPQIPEGQICWIRVHLAIDTSISQLVMLIQQSVASEIFLNGKSTHRLGEVDLKGEHSKAVNPRERIYSFPLDTGNVQTLAVRFAKQPQIGYATHWNSSNPAFSVKLNGVEAATAYYQQRHTSIMEYNHSRTGIFGILGVLYLAFYVFYPVHRANLYFSVYAFLQSITWSTFIFYHRFDWVEYYPVIANALLVLQLISHIFMLEAIYESRKMHKDWIYYMLVVFAVACIPIGIFGYDWGWKVYGRNFTLTYFIGVTFILFRSFRANRIAASIVVIGGICFMLIWMSFIFMWYPAYSSELFSLAHLSMPLAVSIYLGYEFALTSRSLQQKLAEVSTLSKEKEQILTNQNETLERQVTERTAALKQSMDELKSTQTQLIHSEKMASLGELTAGIAHEIQNPLNFVNNFSEVNAELIDDLKKELTSGNNKSAEEIADTIRENQEKINHHGKRADAIVKSMLMHSRKSTGQKELTDINALCEEYLRLAYHGIRAKDKSFNASIQTELDPSVGRIMVTPQDIGRVILNLINNAFYAVAENARQQLNGYEPRVTVKTKNLGDKVEIRVIDNGSGIPDAIRRKIFQPFFTTKPTGQGTGLGLSLVYDIVVKTHAGELTVESTAGAGSEFIVRLPVR